jgi:hypothetical protein
MGTFENYLGPKDEMKPADDDRDNPQGRTLSETVAVADVDGAHDQTVAGLYRALELARGSTLGRRLTVDLTRLTQMAAFEWRLSQFTAVPCNEPLTLEDVSHRVGSADCEVVIHGFSFGFVVQSLRGAPRTNGSVVVPGWMTGPDGGDHAPVWLSIDEEGWICASCAEGHQSVAE